MALVTPTEARRGDEDGSGFIREVTWVLTSADVAGVGVPVKNYADLCWHASGTWGGATAAVQGSNTDTDALYGALTNVAGGSAITWTSDGAPKQSIELPSFVRPKLTTAGTDASVTVVLRMRKPRG